MFGLNPCINTVLSDLLFEILVAYLIELSAGYGVGGIIDDAQLKRNRNCGVLVVSGYHNRNYACASAFFNRRLDFGTNRVNHARQTDENKVVFKRFGRIIRRSGVIFSERNRKNSQSLVRHSLVVGGYACSDFVSQGNYVAVNKCMGAFFENLIGSALSVLNNTVGSLMNG